MAEIDFVSIFAPKMTNIDIFEFWHENSKFRQESILGFTSVTKNARKKVGNARALNLLISVKRAKLVY